MDDQLLTTHIQVWTAGIVLCIEWPEGRNLDTDAFEAEVLEHKDVKSIEGPLTIINGVYAVTFEVKHGGYLLSQIQDLAVWLRRTMHKHFL
jgi:hypothetical protein